MRTALFGIALAIGIFTATQADAQIVYYGGPVPVTTYYAPAYGPVPVTTYYAPAPVTAYYAPAPVYVGRPAVVPPRYFYPGQPVRNMFRRGVVVW